MGGYKSTKEALERGVKFKKVLKEQKGASKPSKWKPPTIPLSTPVGVGGMTLESLMKQEKLDYADAVCVYLAYQDSLKSSGRTKKPAAPDTEKLEDTQSAGNSVPSETGKKKSPKNAPTETEDVQSACNSISSGTGKKKSPKNAPMETETEEAPKKSRNQVSAKSRPSKASLKRGVASSNLGLDQDPEGGAVRPTKRLKGKTPPETIPNPQDDTLCDDEEDAECWDDELSYEYELWRHGLPQLSELESDLKAHRAAPTVPVPGVLVPAESEDQCGSNDSQVCFDCICVRAFMMCLA